MKASLAFAFFLLFLAGIALVNLGNLQAPASAELRPPDAEELVSRRWRLAALRGVEAAYDSGIELMFTRGGLVTADGACNRYTGDYAFTGETLLFTGVAGTRRACAGDQMRYDAALLGVLEATASAATDGRRLILLSDDGARLARFAPAPPGTGEH